MDCRAFRKKHLAFVDDTLPGIDVVVMQDHLYRCGACARHDATIRRALMLARNLPQIEPSSDFTTRLHARLARERLQMPRVEPLSHGPGIRAFVAIAASLVTIGFLAAYSFDWTGGTRELAMQPVVATQPAEPAAPITAPVLVNSMSAGMSVWPVVYLAEQAPAHFAKAHFEQSTGGQ